jgi:hypothetical protein
MLISVEATERMSPAVFGQFLPTARSNLNIGTFPPAIDSSSAATGVVSEKAENQHQRRVPSR